MFIFNQAIVTNFPEKLFSKALPFFYFIGLLQMSGNIFAPLVQLAFTPERYQDDEQLIQGPPNLLISITFLPPLRFELGTYWFEEFERAFYTVYLVMQHLFSPICGGDFDLQVYNFPLIDMQFAPQQHQTVKHGKATRIF